MPQISLVESGSYFNIHPSPRRGTNDKIGLWGPLHGGNLSLKNSLEREAPDLIAAFMALGAQPWQAPNHTGIPHSTPHGGPNFHATLLGITRERAIEFLAEHDYTLAELNGNDVGPGALGVPVPGPRRAGNNEDENGRVGEHMHPLGFGHLGAVFDEVAGHDWYDRTVAIFKNAKRFHAVHADTRTALAKLLPRGVGAYVVRDLRIQPNSASIIYIGMVGTLKMEGGILGPTGGGFPARLQRNTPYCYSSEGPYANHFEFGPTAVGDAITRVRPEDRYESRYPLSQIVTDCFVLTDNEQTVAPAFLEAFLLQRYLSLKGQLPPANQAF
jgi:hypothetical protein